MQTSSNKSTSLRKSVAKPVEGTIVSKQLIKVDGQNPDVNIYKIFYISVGQKVAAFLMRTKSEMEISTSPGQGYSTKKSLKL